MTVPTISTNYHAEPKPSGFAVAKSDQGTTVPDTVCGVTHPACSLLNNLSPTTGVQLWCCSTIYLLFTHCDHAQASDALNECLPVPKVKIPALV